MKNIKNIKLITNCIIFMVILTILFTAITYIFRSDNAQSKLRMAGLKDEMDVDVVCIGSSAVYLYWEPLRAYNEAGFTSYNYATSALPAEAIEYYIKECLKYQTPELFVVECRSFVDWEESFSEVALRYGTDGMTWYSPNRINYIHKYMNNHSLPENIDKLSYYFDIAKYHDNYDELGNADNWKYIDDKIECSNKGFYWMDGYDCLSEPDSNIRECTDIAPLNDVSIEILNDLLDYCDSKELNVLFIVDPYLVSYEEMTEYNYIENIVTQRGYSFLNTNTCYSQMELDFSKDMMNSTHVNCSGAIKFTDFVTDYLKGNFNLGDHRNDAQYDSWNKDYEQFAQEETIHLKFLDDIWNDYDKSYALIDVIKNEEDMFVYNELITDERYYVFSVRNDAIMLTNNNEIILESYDISEAVEGVIGRSLKEPIRYEITNISDGIAVSINEEEIICDNDSEYVIVVDVNLARVVDIRDICAEN